MRWTDDHCHLPADPVRAAAQIEEATAAGVERLVNVGTDLDSSRAAVEIARTSPSVVHATAGLHPHDATDAADPAVLRSLDELLTEPEVVAVGECGLDYHYDRSPRDIQREAFAAQIAMAHSHGLALVIHTREAWDDTFSVLAECGVPDRTVFHCFTGGPDEARRCLDTGAHLSFSGIVTFPSAQDVRDAAALCPLDRLLVETDAPYLAPVPHRGKTNRPALVTVVGAAVAAAKAVEPEVIARASWDAASALYGI